MTISRNSLLIYGEDQAFFMLQLHMLAASGGGLIGHMRNDLDKNKISTTSMMYDGYTTN